MISEHDLLLELKSGNKEAFSLLFRNYYKDLVLFAGNFLPNQTLCEDIVQSVFLKLWEGREVIKIERSLKSFLLRSVQNSCLDELRHVKIVRGHEGMMKDFHFLEALDTEEYVLYSDLQQHLNDALNKLPPNCIEAFRLNRFEGFKYKEIAQRLNVSERTVEVRIGKAINLLRKHLKEFLKILLLFFSI